MNSGLWNRQVAFVRAKGKLIAYAESLGIELTDGDAYRDPRAHGKFGEKVGYGAANSVHKLRLAQDYNTKNPADHATLHDFWDIIGGAERIEDDMNHYSFEWQGKR